jgi:hypothetical protein
VACPPTATNIPKEGNMPKNRLVAMDVSPDNESDAIRLNVDFNFSALTDEQVIDWALSAVKVWYAGRVRPKGESHLRALSKTTQVIQVPPTGTRIVTITDDAYLRNFCTARDTGEFNQKMYDKILAQYGDAATAIAAIKQQMKEMYGA